MQQVEKSSQSRGHLGDRRVARSANGIMEYPFNSQTGGRGALGKHSFIWIADQDRDQGGKRASMRTQDIEARLQREYEAVAPLSRFRFRNPGDKLRGQAVIQFDDDGAFIWEVLIKKADANSGTVGDSAQCCRLITMFGNKPNRRLI